MKLSCALLLAFSFAFAVKAEAQTPIPSPFPSFLSESFDSLPAAAFPSFTGFTGFNGQGQFKGINDIWYLFINNRVSTLPPLSPQNNLFGGGDNVKITFESPHTKFGGSFSRTHIALGLTTATFRFLLNGVQVGSNVTAQLPALPPQGAAYVFVGWDLTAIGAFNEVQIIGNASRPGYVGMDNLIVL